VGKRETVCVARRRVQAGSRQQTGGRTKNKYSNNNNVSDDVVEIAHETQNNHAIINNYQSSATSQ
jgi:hypothetical protein